MSTLHPKKGDHNTVHETHDHNSHDHNSHITPGHINKSNDHNSYDQKIADGNGHNKYSRGDHVHADHSHDDHSHDNHKHDDYSHDDHSHGDHDHDHSHGQSAIHGWQEHWDLLLALTIFVVLLVLKYASNYSLPHPYGFIINLLSYILAVREVILLAIRKSSRGDFFNEFVLMTVATIGAFILGEYEEG